MRQPAPVFPPGESHGQRSLAGYSPWGLMELDTTEDVCIPWGPSGEEPHLRQKLLPPTCSTTERAGRNPDGTVFCRKWPPWSSLSYGVSIVTGGEGCPAFMPHGVLKPQSLNQCSHVTEEATPVFKSSQGRSGGLRG